MDIAIYLSIFIVVVYLGYGVAVSDYKKELKEILGYAVVIGLTIIWGTYILMWGTYSELPFYVYLILSVISVLSLYKYITLSKKEKNSLEIKAKQHSYWGIGHTRIYNAFKSKIFFKKDRFEIKTNELEKIVYRKYSNKDEMITGHIFLNMKNLELTKVDNLNNLESELYKTLYKKAKEILDIQELEIDLEELLKKNDYILEYFFINFWVLYTKRINIGTGTLNVISNTFTEQELIGALDNATLSSIRRTGAGLYYKYLEFKNELPTVQDEDEIIDTTEDEDF